MVKQYKIDNGKIGGIINAYTSSMWITSVFAPISYFMIFTLYLKSYGIELPFYQSAVISIGLGISWVWFDFSFLAKSRMIQSNRQVWEHGNLSREELERIHNKLKEMDA